MVRDAWEDRTMPQKPAQNRMKRCAIALAACAAMLGLSAAALACSVPVFRFALERWQPDKYLVVVFHEGPLDDDAKKLVAQCERAAHAERSANIEVETFDLSEELPPHIRAIWDREQAGDEAKPKLPWCVVAYPQAAQIEKPMYRGPVDEAALAASLDSPLRGEIADRLVSGQSAVWLLLESGDTKADDAAHELIASELKRLEKELKLPVLAEHDKELVKLNLPLAIKFSLLRVKRSDPRERMLVEMLLDTESDLAEISKPMVFPVFGRGRAFYGLIGKGISSENLTQTAGFLIGECSCEVKEQNPGMDLLLAAPWSKIEGNFADEPLPPLVGLPETKAIKTSPREASRKPIALNERPRDNLPMQADAAPKAEENPSPMVVPMAAPTHAYPVWIVSLASLAAVGIVVLLVGSFWISSGSRPKH